jgi:hypothetical protein
MQRRTGDQVMACPFLFNHEDARAGRGENHKPLKASFAFAFPLLCALASLRLNKKQ